MGAVCIIYKWCFVCWILRKGGLWELEIEVPEPHRKKLNRPNKKNNVEPWSLENIGREKALGILSCVVCVLMGEMSIFSIHILGISHHIFSHGLLKGKSWVFD